MEGRTVALSVPIRTPHEASHRSSRLPNPAAEATRDAQAYDQAIIGHGAGNHVDELAAQRGVTRKFDRCVAAGRSQIAIPVGIRRRFNQHAQSLSDQLVEISSPERLFEARQVRDALRDDLARHLVGHRRRGGPGPRAERKNVDLGDPDFLEHSARLFEIGRGFSGESDNRIGRERRLIEPFRHVSAAVDESPRSPAASHPPQHGVRAALQADVQVRADLFGVFGHDVDEFARRLGRLDAREPQAKVTVDLGQAPHQVRQSHPCGFRLGCQFQSTP